MSASSRRSISAATSRTGRSPTRICSSARDTSNSPLQHLAQSRAVAPTRRQLRAVFQGDDELTVKVRLEFFDEVEIDDGGAMDAHEDARVEALLELAQRGADDVFP